MPVDPQVQMLLDLMAGAGQAPISEATLTATRESFPVLVAMTAGPGPDNVSVEDRSIPGPHGDIALRIYIPETADESRGVVVFIHGGGWTIGTAAGYDPIAKMVANDADVVVVSVDYRLSPEHPFPVPYDECWAALQWVVANGAELGADATRVAVMGDSAGGNLSAVMANRASANGGPNIAVQVLIYPATDANFDTRSYVDNAVGYFLERETMQFFWNCYTRSGADPLDPRLSPLREESLCGVAPALVITAEFDPLRDEGEAYAEALRTAGVEVEHTRYEGMIHGFAMMPAAVGAGATALAQATKAIRTAFGKV